MDDSGNSLIGGLLYGPIFIFNYALSLVMDAKLSFDLILTLTVAMFGAGLLFGVIFGTVVGLKYGGKAAIQHYYLRWLLARYNYLPNPFWDLVPFLDYSTDLLFLRKVGGGYIFAHRLLMEHFAEMEA